MKRSIKLAVAAAVALSASSAFATNGDNLIGMGAKARGMGGVGIGMSHGAESGIANPAMITTVKGSEISFGGTVFMPDVETDMGTGGGSIKSDADLSVIPEVAVAQKVNDNFYWGIGMYGVAGMGTDYSDMNTYTATNGEAAADAARAYATAPAPGGLGLSDPATIGRMMAGAAFQVLAQDNFNMKTNLQLMQFAVPLAFTTSGFTVAVAPVLQYGSLDINYNILDTNYNKKAGNTRGIAQDFGVGYTLGLAYAEEGLTLGASYKSSIDMTYDGQISAAIRDFTTDPVTGQASMSMSDDLEQPAEIGAGISYKFGGNTIALDYKRVKWESAKGYKDFGWQDQDVYAIGYQYAQDAWAVRLGYNYADSAVKSNVNTVLNTLNLLGFPATVQEHYTIGGSYAITNTTSIDLAYVYSPEETEQYANMLNGTTTTKHSQDAFSAQVAFKF